ncbi:hypothetical protein Pmani_007385 [Petrolisthes manimaculis]|uniref:Peptidylglycine monooxygenase n=1 Tax=Petrolisthes manimaculis TaxID=1843537 RepID=A0AAE1Q8J1_9EUCA|nr:hypothetical protein Pmani_007385 [Petrolisthes manimaculis]
MLLHSTYMSPAVMAYAAVVLMSLVPSTLAWPGYSRREEPTMGQTMDSYIRSITMPGVTPKKADEYLCTATPLNRTTEEWVVRFDPMASANRAHHMLLFGCSEVDHDRLKAGYWDCGHHGVCAGGRIMYAWAKNAPPTALPDQVGFRVGGRTGINYLTMQIHYALPLEDGVKDMSGLKMEVTQHRQKYKAGIYLLAAGNVIIPPNTLKTHADMNCEPGMTGEPVDINIFAYRVHAHVLGTVISGYHYSPETKVLKLLAKGNPQWPQAFYPTPTQRVQPNDILHARCTWNSTGRNRYTNIGSTSADEMCNLYLMYYTDRDLGSESGGCWQELFPELTRHLPQDSDTPLPPNPLLEEHAHGENRHKETAFTYNNVNDGMIELEKKAQSRKDPQPGNSRYSGSPSSGGVGEYEDAWSYLNPHQQQQQQQQQQLGSSLPKDTSIPTLAESPRTGKQLKGSAFKVVDGWGVGALEGGFGQVTAVSLDSAGDVVIFHRGERSWDGSTFRGNRLRDPKLPITRPAIIHMAKDTGRILHKWGENFYFVPHGLTVDKDDNIWVTDVGLHQVFKFPAGYGNGTPLITLGTRFEPGSDTTHFCKPTAVAVLPSGEFFVSDGYCNSRVLKYNADGKLLFQFGKPTGTGLRISSPPPSSFFIPHALTLVSEEKDNPNEVCVADRENGRVQCFTVDQGKFTRQFHFTGWGSRLFSVAYTPARGGRLFAVNGPPLLGSQKLMTFEVDYSSGELLGGFSPNNQGLSNPHDLAVSSDGSEVYVVEIGPNKVWKFQLESALRSHPPPVNISKLNPVKELKLDTKMHAQEKSSRVSPAALVSPTTWWPGSLWVVVVVGLLAVPIVVLTTFTILIRARRSGRLRLRNLHNGSGMGLGRGRGGKHENGLTLGSLLNSRRGFEQVATEDLDHDAPDSGDSDVEEFSQVASRA